MKSIKVCEYSRSRSFHYDLILQDQASGERSQDQWSSGLVLWLKSHDAITSKPFFRVPYHVLHKLACTIWKLEILDLRGRGILLPNSESKSADLHLCLAYRVQSFKLGKKFWEKFCLSPRKFGRSFYLNFRFAYIYYTFSLLPQLKIGRSLLI